jgi:WD40 repeat protein
MKRSLYTIVTIALVTVAVGWLVLLPLRARPALAGRYDVIGSRGIDGFALANDELTAYLACSDGIVRSLNLGSGDVTQIRSFSQGLNRILLIESEGAIVLGDTEGWLRLCERKTGEERFSIRAHPDTIFGLTALTDGTIISGARDDPDIIIWEAPRGMTAKLIGHADGVLALVASPDGGRLASGGHDNSIRIWDLRKRKTTAILTGHEKSVLALEFIDNRILLSTGFDKTLRAWDLETNREIAQGKGQEHLDSIAFSSEASLVAAGDGDGFIGIWSWPTLNLRWYFEAHQHTPIHRLQFIAQGRKLVSSCIGVTTRDGIRDGEVAIWNLPR